MSKKSFDRSVRKRIEQGLYELTRAKHPGSLPALILTNRLADVSREVLAAPHEEAFCDECNAPVVLHSETLRQAPGAKIVCAHCAGDSIPEGWILRVNPDALTDMLLGRWRGWKR